MSVWSRLGQMFSSGSGDSPSVVATGIRPLAVSAAELRIEAGVASDPGCVRTINEDALRVIRPTTPDALAQHGVLAVVCDGMGGHEAGGGASALALQTIVQRYEADDRELPLARVRAIKAANSASHAAAEAKIKLRGMGTTSCALALRYGSAYCAHVADSRCYLLRDGDIYLLTEDRSAVMDLVHPRVIPPA